MNNSIDNHNTNTVNQELPPLPQNQPTATTPYQQTTEIKPKKGLALILSLSTLFLLLIIGYFVNSLLLSPAKIREQVTLTQEVIIDYNKNLKNITTALVEDDPETSAGMERDLEKAKSLLNEAEKNQKKLDELKAKISSGKLDKYKKSLEEYTALANEAVAVQKDYVAIGESYIKPFKAYEELNVAAAGISNYMYTDPNKYVSELEKYIVDHEAIYLQLKAIQPSGWFVETHQATLKSIDSSTKLLKDMKEAVGKRSQQDIITATKKFEEANQAISIEMEKAEDNFDKQVKDMTSKIEDIFNDIESEYMTIKVKYKL